MSAPPTRTRPPLAWRLTPDANLERAAGTGDERALEVLLDRHRPALVRYCRGLLLDGDEAQDAVQAAHVAALRALRGAGPRPTNFRAWLFRIAHHEALRLLRARPAVVADADDALARIGTPGPADDAVRERLTELVDDLRTLPDRQRGALLLRELSGLDYAEVATTLGGTEGSARQAVFEARAGLAAMHAGRATPCEAVRRTLSDDDRRVARGRAIRAHLKDCADCAEFSRQLKARRRDLRLLFPAGPALACFLAAGGGGGAAAGSGALLAAGGGSGVAAVKCVVVCGALALGGVAALDHHAHRAPARTAHAAAARPSGHAAPAPAPAAAARAKAAARRAVSVRQAALRQQAVIVREQAAAHERHVAAKAARRATTAHAERLARHRAAAKADHAAPLIGTPAAPATAPAAGTTTAAPSSAPSSASVTAPSAAPVSLGASNANRSEATPAELVRTALAQADQARQLAAQAQQSALASAQSAAAAAVQQAQQAAAAAQAATAASATTSASAQNAVDAALAQADQAAALMQQLFAGRQG